MEISKSSPLGSKINCIFQWRKYLHILSRNVQGRFVLSLPFIYSVVCIDSLLFIRCLSYIIIVCFLNSLISIQSLSHVQIFVTPWTAAHQASLSITNSWSPPKLMSTESVMPSNHLILCRLLLLLPSIFPSIRVFSNESALHIRLTQSGTHFSLTSWEGYISIFIIFSKKFTKSQT